MIDFDIDRIEAAVSADTPEAKCFVKHCREYGLEPDMLFKKIMQVHSGIEYTILGMIKKGRFASIIIEKCADKSVQMPVDIRKINNNKFYNFV